MRPTRLAVAAEARQARSLREPLGGALLAMLLAVGLGIALAGAALAGPVSTTTSTTIFGATTTTSTTTTSTTGPPTTTSPSTTSTTSTSTTSTTSTTTTTTLPGLTGVYPFEDKDVGDKSINLLNVDTTLDEICLAGSAQGVDAISEILNRRVTFSYQAFGSISKESDKKVQGDFVDVQVALNLTIQEIVGAPPPPIPPPEFDETIFLTTKCKLKVSLTQPGGPQSTERARDSVSLDCDLGPNFEAFGDLDQALLTNIQEALEKRKFNLKKGRLKIKTSGIESLPSDDQTIFGKLRAECATPG